MRKLLALAVILALALLVVGTSADAKGNIGARYVWAGSMGQLSIANANGLQYTAYDSQQMCVSAGTVEGNLFTVMCGNSGPDANGVVLTVTVGEVVFDIGDWDWHWDR